MGILLVFAQMEREATGERTKEAIHHIRKSGYHFGRVPYGKRSIPAPDHPRMKILVEDEAEQRTISQKIKEWANEGVGNQRNGGATELERESHLRRGKEWTKSLLYNLRLRLSFISPKPHNARPSVIRK